MAETDIVQVEISFKDGTVHRFMGDDAVEWMRLMNDAVMWKQCNDGVCAPCPQFQVQSSDGISFVKRDPGGSRSDRIPCVACRGCGWVEKETEKTKEKPAKDQQAATEQVPVEAVADVVPEQAVESPATPAAEAPLDPASEPAKPADDGSGTQGSLFG